MMRFIRSLMNHPVRSTIILALAAAGLAAYVWLTPAKPDLNQLNTASDLEGDFEPPVPPLAQIEPSEPTSVNFPALPPLAESADGPNVRADRQLANDPIDQINQNLIRQCLGAHAESSQVHFGAKMTLADLSHDLFNSAVGQSANASSPRVESEILNFHAKRSDGRVQRLHISPHEAPSVGSSIGSSGSSEKVWTIGPSDYRVFDVDAEDLPVAVPFPTELKIDHRSGVIASFASPEQLIFSERRAHEVSPSGVISSNSVETNGRLTELQIFIKDQSARGSRKLISLGCAWQNEKLDCRCL